MKWFMNERSIHELVQKTEVIIEISKWSDKLLSRSVRCGKDKFKLYNILMESEIDSDEKGVIMVLKAMRSFDELTFFDKDGRELKLKLFGGIKVV